MHAVTSCAKEWKPLSGKVRCSGLPSSCPPVAHQLPTGIAEQSGSWKGGFSDEEDEDDEEEADEEEAESNVMKAGDRWELQEEATVQQRSGRLLCSG